MAEGDIECMFDDKNLGIILTSLLGASPVITGSSPWTHTYILSNSNQHQSLSILYQDPDIAEIFPMAVVDSFKMTVDQNAIVSYTVGFKSRVGRDWTPQTLVYTSLGNKFLHQHLIFKLASTIGGLSGSTAISLKKLELTIKTNTKFDTVIGTVEPEDILNQQFSVEGQVELNKEDQTYRRYMLDNTYKACDITLRRSASSSLQFQLPRVDFSAWEQDRKLGDIVSQKIQFKGNVDNANALDIISTCILTNSYNGAAY